MNDAERKRLADLENRIRMIRDAQRNGAQNTRLLAMVSEAVIRDWLVEIDSLLAEDRQ